MELRTLQPTLAASQTCSTKRKTPWVSFESSLASSSIWTHPIDSKLANLRFCNNTIRRPLAHNFTMDNVNVNIIARYLRTTIPNKHLSWRNLTST